MRCWSYLTPDTLLRHLGANSAFGGQDIGRCGKALMRTVGLLPDIAGWLRWASEFECSIHSDVVRRERSTASHVRRHCQGGCNRPGVASCFAAFEAQQPSLVVSSATLSGRDTVAGDGGVPTAVLDFAGPISRRFPGRVVQATWAARIRVIGTADDMYLLQARGSQRTRDGMAFPIEFFSLPSKRPELFVIIIHDQTGLDT